MLESMTLEIFVGGGQPAYFAGAQKAADGKYSALFVLVGKDGIVPKV